MDNKKVDKLGDVVHKEDRFSSSSQEDLSLQPYGPPGFRGIAASRYVAVCASFSAVGGLLFGYEYAILPRSTPAHHGVISVTLTMDQFLDRFHEVADGSSGSGFYKGLMTAMITLGAFIGALNQGWIADVFSRKYSIMVAVVVFIVGSVLQTAAIDYAMLIVGRLIGGIGIGMLSMVVPLYISEISPPEIRGTLLVLEELSIVIGIVVAFWITYGTQYIDGTHWSWQLPFVIQIIPGVFLGLGATFLPFSPRWLASKGRDDEALKNLAKFRQLPETDSRVRREWLEIISESRFQKQVLSERHPDLVKPGTSNAIKLEFVAWTDCVKKGCWRRTHVGAGIMFFQQRCHQFVGINALIYYSPTLFGTMGLGHNMQLIMSGVLNMTQLIGVASSLWTMDRFGRRNLLMLGSVLMCISHVIIAILVGLFSENWPAHQAQGWTSVAFLLFYMLAFGASWGPIPWAMPSEIFPSSLRAKGVAISTCSNWLNNFIIGLITPPLVQSTGFGAYVFFASFCLLSLVWTFFFVPETNGKTLEEMDNVFKDRDSTGELVTKQRIFEETRTEKFQSRRSEEA
ncbi:Sugar (and other) transporter [Geosmithia morbida]|uniref:Sugar (And other) transporter n=1 Tax=Geosmithia morbida TaxID=1094350 RepID=A0A9P4YYU4_9HYPO|nr:Sugar (and other) transporter [Geosmithia morbida]KAF4124297.1 Sugar (and other) transporter [Geosmithia morbida]